MDNAEQFIKSGVRPLEIRYKRVISTEFEKPFAYRSVLRVNSLNLGVLTPEQYAPVAERNELCIDLASYNLEALVADLAQMIERGAAPDWVSLSIPLKMLRRVSLAGRIRKIFTQHGLDCYNKLCLELPPAALYEDRAEVNRALTPLLELGVRLMLCGFGDEFCPTMRLKGLQVNMILLDGYISGFINDRGDFSIPSAVIDFCRELGHEVIAGDVQNEQQISEAFTLGCIGVDGKVCGADIKLSTIIRNS